MTGPPSLARRLGVADAVVIGLGSMIGAGVFSAFGPAAAVAGTGLLIGLLLVAGVAYCNAVASAQLAAQYPTSGGTYVYGRERLGAWWGFLAGWGFVIGKIASCAAMTLTFATYAVPGSVWAQRVVGVVGLGVLIVVNYLGVTKTARVTRVLVSVTLAVLLVVVVTIVASRPGTGAVDGWASLRASGAYGVLQAAGFLFFAFAGYARIATLGEEVRDPTRTIPRAIPLALAITVAVYLAVGLSILLAAGPDAIAASAAPVATAVEAVGAAWAVPVVRAGAAVASLGALLALIAGVSRTVLAMGRAGDLPSWLAAVHPRSRVPHHAEIGVGAVVAVLVLTTDLRGAIGFSSFGVLIYYGVANASAFTQDPAHRRWPRALNVIGLVGCAALAVTLPWTAVVTGLAVLGAGSIGRLLFRRKVARDGSGTVTQVDRETWLAARRVGVEDGYTRDAPTYDDGYDPVTPVHRRFVGRLIETTPRDGSVLDAACGTGPYMGMVLEAGRRVVGADQSHGMLERAREKHPGVRVERIGLQELAFEGEFDAAMCVDAMEHVPPEDWPATLGNLLRALRPGGHLYLTVEQVDRAGLDRAFEAAVAAGLPVVRGEDVGDGTGGYHHYPDREQVARWLTDVGFAVVDDADEWLDGYGYHHLLVRAP